MTNIEPKNPREWTAPQKDQSGRLFTCGRPGRATFGTRKGPIDEMTIGRWINGLPNSDVLHIVSLLGNKPSGESEFSYYPFRSSKESNEKPTFQSWLDQHSSRSLVVYEFPTIDRRPVRGDILESIKRCVSQLLERGCTVTVIDLEQNERPEYAKRWVISADKTESDDLLIAFQSGDFCQESIKFLIDRRRR